MSKILVYERLNSEVLTLDTVTGAYVNLGGALPTTGVIDTIASFDGRSQNLVGNFRGDVYVVTRATGNFGEVFKLTGGAWVKMTDIFPTGGGTLAIVGLFVNNERLCIAYVELGFAPLTTFYHVESSIDGAAWVTTSNGPFTGFWDLTGTGFRWRQAVFFAGAIGICGFENTPAFTNPTPDGGNDGGLISIQTEAGCFASWNNDLYFLRPEVGLAPRLYQLDPAWDVSAPTPVPAWTNQLATGIPAMSFYPIAPDGPRPCLFRSANDDLCIFQSGDITALSKTDVATYPVFQDLSSLVPAAILALADARIWHLEDDRRFSNAIQYFMVRDDATATHYLLSWDGVLPMVIEQTIPATPGLNVMFPQEPYGDLRIFTNRQPQVHFDPVPGTAFVENFPGQYTLTYTLIDDLSRPCSVSPEYSTDGDTWSLMTEGSPGSDGKTAITSSPAGISHTFVWDAFIDLCGTYPNMQMRIVPRISGV